MSTPVEKIKERLGVAEVIESYVKLDRVGGNFKGRCPFHNEKTPSFFVSPDRGTYYCFGCGAKGDIFSFVQAFEGLDFMGALKLLASRAGVELVAENPQVKSERERYYAIMEEAARHYEALLTTHKEPQEYLSKRGLTPETIKEFRIGFAPDDWRTMYTHLRNKKYSDADIEKVGLIKKPDNKEGAGVTASVNEPRYFDRFRSRIMFPIMDSSGRVIAFTGRIFNGDETIAKYLNSPETPLYNKAQVLYGIDKAKLEIRKRGYTIFVEGQMDLIMSHQAGFKNTVAGSGTALTDSLTDRENIVNNLGIVKRISPNIIMVYDSDKAGVAAAERSAQIALSLGMDVKIGTVPEGKDPADLILKDKELWKDVLKNAKHVIEFVLVNQIKAEPDKRKLAKVIAERVLPFVAQLKSHMERAHFVSMIKERAGIDEAAIWADLKRVEKELAAQAFANANGMAKRSSGGAAATPSVAKDIIHTKDNAARKVFGILYWQEAVKAIDVEQYQSKLKEILGDIFVALKKETEAQKNELIFEAELVYGKSQKLSEDLNQMLVQIEEDYLKEQFNRVMIELTTAERSKDEAKAMQLLEKCQQYTKRLAELAKMKN